MFIAALTIYLGVHGQSLNQSAGRVSVRVVDSTTEVLTPVRVRLTQNGSVVTILPKKRLQ